MPSTDMLVEQAGGRSALVRFLLFCAVGGSGMVVDFGSFHALRAAGLLGDLDLGVLRMPYANMLSVALAIQWNFYLNWRWTFGDRDVPAGPALWRFNVFCSVTWALNQIIVGVLTAIWPGTIVLPFIGAVSLLNFHKIVAIGVCTFANFFLSTKLAFKASR